MSEVRRLIVEILGKSKEAVGAFAETDAAAAKSEGAFKKLGGIAAGVTAGLAVAVGAVGVMSIKMADEVEKSHAKLSAAIDATGGHYGQFKKQIDAVVKSGTDFGYNSAQIQDAIATMTPGFGSAGAAIKELGVDEDLAKFKNMDLSQAAMIVTKAHEGQLKPLKALGIDLPLAAGGALKLQKANDALAKANENLLQVEQKIHDGRLKGPAAADALRKAHESVTAATEKLNTTTSTGDQLLAALAKTTSGQAAAAADTFHGKVAKLKAESDNLMVSLGKQLIPIIEKVASALLDGALWMEKHKVAAAALAIVVGGVLVAAVVAWTVSMVAAAAATFAAFAPVILVVAALGLLAAAVWYAWTHFDGFRKGVQLVADWFMHTFVPWMEDVWTKFKAGVSKLVDFIHGAWNIIKSITNAVWVGIQDVIHLVWDQIYGIIHTALDFIHGIITIAGDIITGKWGRIWEDVKNIVARVFGDIGRTIWGVLQNIWQIIVDFGPNIYRAGLELGKMIISGLIDFVKNAGHLIVDAIKGAVGSLPGGGAILSLASAVHIPGFATGGTVPGPVGQGMLAMVHGGETIIPVSGSGGGGGNQYTIQVSTLDARAGANAVIEAIQVFERTNGNGWRS